MTLKKSYWQSVVCRTDNDKENIRAWFPYLGEAMTPYQCDVLCDIETDREKKLRAYMTDVEGRKYLFTRNRSVKGIVSISQKRIP